MGQPLGKVRLCLVAVWAKKRMSGESDSSVFYVPPALNQIVYLLYMYINKIYVK